MTLDDLEKELPLLFAFTKVVLLDRDAARIRMRQWLRKHATPPLLAWTSRLDAYRGLMRSCPLNRSVSGTTLAKGDPLGNRLFWDMTAAQRARCFLMGPCGFSDEAADKIVNRSWPLAPLCLREARHLPPPAAR